MEDWWKTYNMLKSFMTSNFVRIQIYTGCVHSVCVLNNILLLSCSSKVSNMYKYDTFI